jgi:glycine/D-amino acid oxidase-like deaminating enzyme
MVKKIREPERFIPVKDEVDVLVAGGGPSGFAAAVCAARMGVKTLLIEQTGSIGGVATSGLMSHWTGDTRGGFYEELLDRSSDIKTPGDPEKGFTRQIINPERLKTAMLDMLYESGAKLLLYTFACEAIMEENRIKGVIIESKSGREAILAKVVIDATGDGDIAAKAGAPFILGREEDGKMQPMTLMFKVAGVDTDRAVFPGKFEEAYKVPAGDLQELGRQHLPFPAGHVLLYRTSLPGIVTCNMTNCIGVDGTKVEDLTKADYVCRKQLDAIVSFLKKFVPGFENCFLISSASMIGVRETRHFQGEYTLTGDDIANARIFEDWAVRNAHFNFDVHNLTGCGLDKTGMQKKFKQEKSYTIPYRCFIPKKVDGLFLTGRNISGTHLAHSNFRVMPICVKMGEAVGTAAALCIYDDITPRQLNVSKLQEKLKNT